jgi:hypothetical protein
MDDLRFQDFAFHVTPAHFKLNSEPIFRQPNQSQRRKQTSTDTSSG